MSKIQIDWNNIIDECIREKFTYFWKSNSPFSQHYNISFKLEGLTFNCCEQYYMYRKAETFHDETTARNIMNTTWPNDQKYLGKHVNNFDELQWFLVAEDVVYKANLAKFSQHLDLLLILLSTEGTTLVEASKMDKKWGIGATANDASVLRQNTFKGLNNLGKVLTQVRNDLLENNNIWVERHSILQNSFGNLKIILSNWNKMYAQDLKMVFSCLKCKLNALEKKEEIFYFDSIISPFGMQHISIFKAKDFVYISLNHFLMHNAALKFGQRQNAYKIYASFDQEKQYNLYMYIKNFDAQKYEQNLPELVRKGIELKFYQNPNIMAQLLGTRNKNLKYLDSDSDLGIGTDQEYKAQNFNGRNILGKQLSLFRDELFIRENLCDITMLSDFEESLRFSRSLQSIKVNADKSTIDNSNFIDSYNGKNYSYKKDERNSNNFRSFSKSSTYGGSNYSNIKYKNYNVKNIESKHNFTTLNYKKNYNSENLINVQDKFQTFNTNCMKDLDAADEAFNLSNNRSFAYTNSPKLNSNNDIIIYEVIDKPILHNNEHRNSKGFENLFETGNDKLKFNNSYNISKENLFVLNENNNCSSERKITNSNVNNESSRFSHTNKISNNALDSIEDNNSIIKFDSSIFHLIDSNNFLNYKKKKFISVNGQEFNSIFAYLIFKKAELFELLDLSKEIKNDLKASICNLSKKDQKIKKSNSFCKKKWANAAKDILKEAYKALLNNYPEYKDKLLEIKQNFIVFIGDKEKPYSNGFDMEITTKSTMDYPPEVNLIGQVLDEIQLELKCI